MAEISTRTQAHNKKKFVIILVCIAAALAVLLVTLVAYKANAARPANVFEEIYANRKTAQFKAFEQSLPTGFDNDVETSNTEAPKPVTWNGKDYRKDQVVVFDKQQGTTFSYSTMGSPSFNTDKPYSLVIYLKNESKQATRQQLDEVLANWFKHFPQSSFSEKNLGKVKIYYEKADR